MMRDDTLWAELYAKDYLKGDTLVLFIARTQARHDSHRDCIITR